MHATTTMAIVTHEKIVRAERRLVTLQAEERRYLAGMPDEDRAEYVRATDEIRARYEDKET